MANLYFSPKNVIISLNRGDFGRKYKNFAWTRSFDSHSVLWAEMRANATPYTPGLINFSVIIFQFDGFHLTFLDTSSTPDALLIIGFRNIGGHGMEGPDAFIKHAEYPATILATTANSIEIL